MWISNASNALVLLVSLLTILYLFIRSRSSFWSRKGVAFQKPHLIYGNFGDVLKKKTHTGRALANLYNGFKGQICGGVWEMFTPKLLVVDPNLAFEIMVKDFGIWSNRGITVNHDVDPLTAHLAFLDGKKWKSVRTKLTPTFTSGKLKQMHYLLLECARDLEKYLDIVAEKGEPIEASNITAKFTTDVIGSCVFGIQMNSLNDEDALFRKVGQKLFAYVAGRPLIPLVQSNFPWLFKLLKLTTVSKEATEFFINIVKETFDYREKNNIRRNDFIDLLRNLKNTGEPIGEDEVEFDDKLLAAQAFVFFIAGFETSAATISYCLHELAVNREIQDRLREEIHMTEADSKGEITWDELKNMKYLDNVVRETLRKYPVAPVVERMAVKPYRIPGTNCDLPTGMRAIIPIYAFHHDPEYYPDPDKFDPERFTPEAKARRPAFTYIPFGGGPRICIGSRFAEQQTKMAIITILDSFEVSLCEKSQNPLRYKIPSLLLRTEIGVWLNLSRITFETSTDLRLSLTYERSKRILD